MPQSTIMMIAHTWPAFYQEINTHIIITLFLSLSRNVPVFEKLCLRSIHMRRAFVWIQTFHGLNCIKCKQLALPSREWNSWEILENIFYWEDNKRHIYLQIDWSLKHEKLHCVLSCYVRMNKAAYFYFKRFFKTLDKLSTFRIESIFILNLFSSKTYHCVA